MIAILAVAGIACDGDALVDRRGRIIDGDSIVVTIPAEFEISRPDTVTITSFGNSCVSHARTEVEVYELSATVEPYDFDARLTPSDFLVCNDLQKLIIHRAELTFDRTGEATIWFVGLDHWLSDGHHDSVAVVRRNVLVR